MLDSDSDSDNAVYTIDSHTVIYVYAQVQSMVLESRLIEKAARITGVMYSKYFFY